MKKIKNIILHVGTDKTGSTAIQSAFVDNRSTFEECGIIYSNGVNHNDKLLSIAFCKTKARAKKLFNVSGPQWRSDVKRYLKRLEDKVDSTDADTLVISHEGIMHLDSEELDELCQFLKTLGESVYVVMYARDPVSYAVSAMSQRAKTGRYAWSSCMPVIEYKVCLGRLVLAFGRDNVNVRLFDTKVFLEGDVVLDFLSIPLLVKSFDFNDVELERNFKGNPSLTGLGVVVSERILTILGRHKLKNSDFKRTFLESLVLLKGGKIKLSNNQLKSINKCSTEHLGYLKKEFNVSFSYPIDSSGDTCGREKIKSQYIEDLARNIIFSKIPDFRFPIWRRIWRDFRCWYHDAL